MREHFGTFLLIEIWSQPDVPAAEASLDIPSTDDSAATPNFEVVCSDLSSLPATVDGFRSALEEITIAGQPATVAVREIAQVAPPGLLPLGLSCDGSASAGCVSFDSLEDYLASVQNKDADPIKVTIDDLDVLLLRNDPENLAHAINKTYFQHFPEQVRPKACISRDPDEIKLFIKNQHDKVVIKPLQGSGGQSVFLIDEDEHANINQMIEAVTRDAYCIVQEYLPAAADGDGDGDVRLFVMNGRVHNTGDARSNMHSGGKSEAVEVTDKMLEMVEMVRPQLVRDGMFLVGLDIVEDKLMEINGFSPGGLGSSHHHTGVDFSQTVIRDLERKVKYKEYYGAGIRNVDLATL